MTRWDFVTGIPGSFNTQKSIYVMHHNNKREKHMIISKDKAKVFHKI